MATCPKCSTFYANATSCSHDGTLLIEDDKARARGLVPLAAERFEILSLLGEGGMGVVYLAMHRDLRRKVALKVLRKEGQGAQALERFKREARASSMIAHRNVVSIIDFGELPDGSMFYVMEFLEGKSLADAIDNDEPFSLARVLMIAVQVAKGLAAAHEKNIIHRDLKPDNIFLLNNQEYPDFVKILDFGIAKLSDVNRITKTGMVLGTPDYMSPEQAMGKQADLRADIYALGILLYEMLVGQRPFMGDSFMQVLSQHLYAPPPLVRENRSDIEIPEGLDKIIQKALAKKPEERFQSMEEVLTALYALPNALDALPESLLPNSRRTVPPVMSQAVRAVSNTSPPRGSSVGGGVSRSAPTMAPQPSPTQPAPAAVQAAPTQPPPPSYTARSQPARPQAVTSPPQGGAAPWTSGGYRNNLGAGQTKPPVYPQQARPQPSYQPPPTIEPLPQPPEEEQPTSAWMDEEPPAPLPLTNMIPVDFGSSDNTGMIEQPSPPPAPPAPSAPATPAGLVINSRGGQGKVVAPAPPGPSRLGRSILPEDDYVDQATSVASYPVPQRPAVPPPTLLADPETRAAMVAGVMPASYEESRETSATQRPQVSSRPARPGDPTLLDGSLNAKNLAGLLDEPEQEATIDLSPSSREAAVNRSASTQIYDSNNPAHAKAGLTTLPEQVTVPAPPDNKATLDMSRDQLPSADALMAKIEAAGRTESKTDPGVLGAMIASTVRVGPVSDSAKRKKLKEESRGPGWVLPVVGLVVAAAVAAAVYFFILS